MGCTCSMTCPERKPPSCDGYKGTPLRMLGYATHVGNACSAILPYSVIQLPNMVTTAYISADVFNNAIKSSEAGKSRAQIFVNTLDAVIWHSLATLFIPGLIINKVKQFTVQATKTPPVSSCTPPPPLVKALPPAVLRALPCILGVLTLPLIMYPIDKAVTLLMDYTYRPLFKDPDPEELKIVVPKPQKVSNNKPDKKDKGAN